MKVILLEIDGKVSCDGEHENKCKKNGVATLEQVINKQTIMS